ncbi:MAG: hypothetical protein AB8B51_19430 [Sedimentitalea sp.]
MFSQIKSALLHNRETLVSDALGMAALLVMLVASLHLPGAI